MCGRQDYALKGKITAPIDFQAAGFGVPFFIAIVGQALWVLIPPQRQP